MRRTMNSALLAATMALSTLLGACGGDSGGSTTPALVVTTVEVEPGTATLTVGDTVRLVAKVKDQNGAALGGKVATWSSSATSVATVATSGTVTGVSVGSATITATVDGREGRAILTLQPPPLVVTTVEVGPAANTLSLGDTVRLTATIKDQNGAVMTGKTPTWTSGAPAVVTVSTAGLLTAVGPGNATVSAVVDGKTGNASVNVRGPVASLILVPDSATVQIGATLALQATLRDAQGAVLTGRTIAWRSLDPTVATVSNVGVVSAVQLGRARIVATAESKSDTAAIRVPAPPIVVSLEPGAAKTATIGQAGGRLETVDAAGIRYTFDVAAGALMTPVAITMTPARSVANFPLSGGLVAGVEFAPSGLSFAVPAMLTVVTTRQPAAGQLMLGLVYDAPTDAPEIGLAARSGTSISLQVPHFTLVTVGFGTAADLTALLQAYVAGGFDIPQAYLTLLFESIQTSPPDGVKLLNALEGWFDSTLLPQIGAVTSDAMLLRALADFRGWDSRPAFMQSTFGISSPPVPPSAPSLVLRRQRWRTAFAPKIQAAFDGNKQLCAAPGSSSSRLLALDNVFFLAHLGNTELGAGTFTQASVLQGLCASITNPLISLASPLLAGAVHTLDATWGVRLTSSTADNPAHFQIQATAQDGTLDRPGGLTAASPVGFYSTQLTPSGGSGSTAVTLTACYSNLFIAVTPALQNILCRTQLTQRPRVDAAIYFKDFTTGPAGPEWSTTAVTTSPSGQRFLGELGNSTTTLTLNSLPAHTRIILDFDLYIIDSWNGNGGQGNAAAPDIIDISVVGGQSLKRTTFSNKPRDLQAFPGDYPGAVNPAGTGSLSMSALGYPTANDHFGDSAYRIRLTFIHLSGNITLNFTSQQTSGQNERWGLDNVRLTVVP